MPKIEIYPNPEKKVRAEWRCDIHHGPGHHGVGSDEAEALQNAAIAWRYWNALMAMKNKQ